MNKQEKSSRSTMQDTLLEMIRRSEAALAKSALGTSQSTLLKNRIKALQIALSLLSNEFSGVNDRIEYTMEDFKSAIAPLTSLINKSEKAKSKLDSNSWQYAMLTKNLEALYFVYPSLENAIALMEVEESSR